MGRAPNHLKTAANACWKRGWLPHPLDGKIPLTPAWQKLPRDPKRIAGLGWDKATGLGIVLGKPSKGLACIDVDDADLGRAIFAWLIRSHILPLTEWTPRGGLHVFVREKTPGASTSRHVRWEERDARVDLLAEGKQVAISPSPGYTRAREAAPWEDFSLASAWARIVHGMSLNVLVTGAEGARAGGYPRPWLLSVGQGERDNSAFIESCRLREAGVPMRMALDFMAERFHRHYQKGGIAWAEIERTVFSAYSRGGGGREVRMNADERILGRAPDVRTPAGRFHNAAPTPPDGRGTAIPRSQDT